MSEQKEVTSEPGTDPQGRIDALVGPLTCPLCGEPLTDDWGGYPACFCAFGGRSPSAEEVIWLAEIAAESGSRH